MDGLQHPTDACLSRIGLPRKLMPARPRVPDVPALHKPSGVPDSVRQHTRHLPLARQCAPARHDIWPGQPTCPLLFQGPAMKILLTAPILYPAQHYSPDAPVDHYLGMHRYAVNRRTRCGTCTRPTLRS